MAVWSRTSATHNLTGGEVSAVVGLTENGVLQVLRKLVERRMEPCLGALRTSRSWDEVQRAQGIIHGLEGFLGDIERILKDAKDERSKEEGK